MKIRYLAVPVFSLLLIVTSVTAQDLSALMDAIQKLEAKLEAMVKQETNARIAADNRLKASIPGKGAGGSAEPDSGLTAAIENLKKAVTDVQTNQADLAKQLDATANKLQELQEKEGDERIAEMAAGLQELIDELKKAIKMKEEEEEEEVEAMEIGGLVTVDVISDPKEMEASSMEVSEVALSANVNIAEGVVATITLLAEGNMSEISIDEALIEFAPEKKPVSLIFGQQTFNHGLLTTHLVSDPSILDLVETKGPGLTVSFPFNDNFTPGLAMTFFHEDGETETVYNLNLADSSVTAEDVVIAEERNVFAGIVNLDFGFLEESSARISMIIHGDILGIDAATELILGPVAVDLEGFSEVTDDDDAKASGFFTGLAYGINDNIEAALRYDGISEDSFGDLEHRLGVGATFGFKYGIFCAFEYAYNGLGSDEGANEIGLQLGLESTIKLPGFHRKTLTRK